MQQKLNLEIMSFVEKEILPRYNAFGKSHGLQHVQHVISNSLELVPLTGADINMAYVIAAYHDLGMEGPRAIHHITSGKILQADARLKKWFSPEQIKIMKEAVEDHRASSSRQPRSIYGKIVAEADRDLDPETVFTRAIQYGLENYPEKGEEEQWKGVPLTWRRSIPLTDISSFGFLEALMPSVFVLYRISSKTRTNFTRYLTAYTNRLNK